MRYIVDDFIYEAKTLGLFCKELSITEADNIRKTAEEKFCRAGDEPLWERIKTIESSKYYPGQKHLIGKINYNKKIIVFFEKNTDSSAIEINNLHDLSKIIIELFGFVFYVTSRNAEYLLCWNDHEFLIGTGKAKEWIDNMLP